MGVLAHTILLSVASLLLALAFPTRAHTQEDYPKIALMFAHYRPDLTAERVARYDLVIDGGLFDGLGDLVLQP
jgi:hypothetical protein